MLELNTIIFEYFSILRSFPGIWLLADFPIFFLPIFLTGLWLYYTFKNSTYDKRVELMHLFYTCVLGLIFSYIIKQFVDIQRPESYLDQTQSLIMGTIPAKSFPSDHATISFAFTTWLFFTGFKRVGYVFLPFVIVMNISRIIVWVHWPLDIVAWMITWIFASTVFFYFVSKGKLVKKLDLIIISVMKTLRLY